MKPIRNYSDGQWLLLLWAFVLLFLVTGVFLSTLVLVVAIFGAIGAVYTSFLYLRANDFALPFLPARRPGRSEADDGDDDGYDDGYGDEDEDDDGYDAEPDAAGSTTAPVVDSFERPVDTSAAAAPEQRSDAPTSPDLSQGDAR